MKGIVITGRPGSGKTTLFNALVEEVRRRGLRIAGFICPEVRRSGLRIGFRIIDISTGASAWLARRDGCRGGPRIGRYNLCVEDALRIGVEALSKAAEAHLIAIDEIGPMELSIEGLRSEMLRALSSGKPFIVVAHWRLRDPEFHRVLREASWINVKPEAREEAWKEALKLLRSLLGLEEK